MKSNKFLYEYIPVDHGIDTAAKLARQIASVAMTNCKDKTHARQLAQRIADKFHSELAAAIDQEMDYASATTVRAEV